MKKATLIEKTVTPPHIPPPAQSQLFPPQPELELRDYQEQAISDLYKLFRTPNINSALLYAPTGAGKTIMAVKVIADAVSRGRRVLFLVHRKKLVAQTQRGILSILPGVSPRS